MDTTGIFDPTQFTDPFISPSGDPSTVVDPTSLISPTTGTDFSGLNLSPGTATSVGGSTSNPFTDLLSTLGTSGLTSLPALLGALGPLAGLIGGLAQGGTTQTGRQTQNGFQNALTSLTGLQSGTQGQTQTGQVTPQLMPGAQTAATGAQGALNFMGGMSPQAFTQGLQMLMGPGAGMLSQGNPYLGQLASMSQSIGGGNNPYLQGIPGALDALTGASQNIAAAGQIPGAPTPQEIALMQSAYNPMIQGLAKQSIDAARNAGYAGGADLLGTAAAPIMGPALAQVPGMEAQSLLQLMQSIPALKASIASQAAQPLEIAPGALASAGNAYNNQLGIGLSGMGQAAGAFNNLLGTQLGGLEGISGMLMQPQQNQFAGNAQLFGQYPVGQSQNQSQQGQFSQSNQQGTSQQTQFGSQGGQSINQPVNIGQDIGNILLGLATGAGSNNAANQQNTFNNNLLRVLSGQQPQLG